LTTAWTLPPVFDWLQREGAIADTSCGDVQLRHRLRLIVGPEAVGESLAAAPDAFVCGELSPA
jgi:hypothetical protein